jgi:hypothetical protein
MVIQRSAAAEVRQLVAQLVEGDLTARDAASARLAVIGARATRALTRALEVTADPPAQAAILRTLEAIQDPHAVATGSRFVDSPAPEVASAAIALLRQFLRYDDAVMADGAFERLTAVALDATRPEPVRAAALEALSDLPPETTRQLLRQLENDPDAHLREVASHPDRVEAGPATLTAITEASLCPEPHVLRAMIEREGRKAPLAVLGRLVEVIRAREEAETASPRRTEWQAARGAAHQVLAARGSRLALYDLRESLAVAPGPLPVGFLAALEGIGDGSCLDEVAAAYARARAARDQWWTEHLANAFRGIVRRERLTRRSAAVKRVIAKYPQAAEELLPQKR